MLVKSFTKHLSYFLFFHLICFAASGAIETVTTPVPASSLTAGSNHYVQDDQYTYMTTTAQPWNFVNANSIATVAIGVDPNYYQQVSGYGNIDFVLRIYAYDATGGLMPSPTTATLTVNPNTNQAGVHRQMHLFNFTGAYKVRVQIQSIKQNGVNVTPPPNMYMELNIEAERYYIFNENSPIVVNHKLWNLSGSTPTAINSPDGELEYSNADEIEIFWNNQPGAEEYQLEWTYVNNYGDDLSTPLGVGDIYFTKDYFTNNSTRITTTQTSYNIPLLYDRGYIVYRVRGVGRDNTDFSKLVYGVWSDYNYNCGTELTCHDYQRLSGHELGKNWQRSVSFAEEGKKKESIRYFDGTKRGRQTLAQNNTLQKSIVSETFYDYQGRPVIQTLPVPAGEEIKYYEGFNVHASGNEYLKSYYDVDIGTCTNPGAPQMSASSGSSRYYSTANPDKAAQQAFLPEAIGYVFTQTEYTPDNTGRIKRQGGVGANLRIGSGHETKYYYATPDQEELDRLFGTDAGYANHYKKEVVIDPNGQATITYKDLRGKVVATAISGDRPANLLGLKDDLGNYLDQTMTTSTVIDMLDKISVGDSDTEKDKNFLSADGKALEMNYTCIYPKQDVFEAEYDLNIEPFTDRCLDPGFDPVFDLDIALYSDDCGTILYNDHQVVGGATPDGGSSMPYSHPTISPVTSPLAVGSYRVEKRLAVNEDALSEYADRYIDEASCLVSYQTFLTSALSDLDFSDCDTTNATGGWYDCAACVTALGNRNNFIGTQEEWDELVDECNEPCTYISPCDAIKNAMIADLSPGGQYATYEVDDNGEYYSHDPLSIFNLGHNPAFPNELPLKVTEPDGFDGQGEMDLNKIIPNWDPLWVEANLLEYHPEYKYYNTICPIQTSAVGGSPSTLTSEQYDWAISKTFSSADAQQVQYLGEPATPLNLISGYTTSYFPILAKDPYYQKLSTSEQNLFEDRIENYKNSGKDIYEYAAFMAACGNWFGNDYTSCTWSVGSNPEREWHLLKGFYLAAKQEFIFDRATIQALNIGNILTVTGATGYFNGAIGHEKFNFFAYFIRRYNFAFSNWPLSIIKPMVDVFIKQDVSGKTGKLYKTKQKRFAYYDPYLSGKEEEITEGDADYEIYKKTGLCPLANDVKLLLQDLLKSKDITSSSNPAMHSVDGFTRDLYLQVTGFDDVQNQQYAYYEWLPVQNNSRKITASLNISTPVTGHNSVVANSVSNFLVLEFHPQSNFYWDDFKIGRFDITSVRRLVPNGIDPSGYFGFSMEVDILNSDGTTAIEVLTGSIKGINLSNCRGSFTGVAHRSQFADDLEHLMTLLAANSHLTSTTGVSIEQANPPYIYPFESSIEPILDPFNTISQAYKWRKLSTKVFEIGSLGSGRTIRVEFCAAPGFTNGFDDVAFFENIRPLGLFYYQGCIVNGRTPNFMVEGVNVDQSNGTVLGTNDLVGHVGIWNGDTYEGPVDMGYHGSLTADEGSCADYTEVRLAMTEFFNGVMPADYSGHAYPGTAFYQNGYSSSQLLPEILRVYLGNGVPFDNCPVSPDIAYMGVEVPSSTGYYVGKFWSHHGSANLFPPYTITGNEDDFNIEMTECSHSYGYFECNVDMKFVDQSLGLSWQNVVGISHLEADLSTLDTNGVTYNFLAIAHMSGGATYKIRGSSCFPISNCNSCTEVEPEIPTNCWADYDSYETTALGITDLVLINEADFCELDFSTCLTDYQSYIGTMQVTDVTSPFYISIEDFCNKDMAFYLDYYLTYLMDWYNVTTTSGIGAQLPSDFQPFSDPIYFGDFVESGIGLSCVVDYRIADAQSDEVIITDFCANHLPEYPCPVLDFKPFPDLEVDQNPCEEYYTNVAATNALQAYNLYINQVKDDFKRRYIEHCMSTAVETFTRTGSGTADYHNTLYFYDQAGNLVRTVPPKGVATFSGTQLTNVESNRLNNISSVPSHQMSTVYKYNSLNQLVYQSTPDGGVSRFWYDELGRLILSQNAKQAPYNNYSYTDYDELGRVRETGQLNTTLSIEGNLDAPNFPTNFNSSRTEVTRTFYDAVVLTEAYNYYHGLNSDFDLENLQNRVSATAYYESYNASLTNSDDYYESATHYSYDEHGNVKTLIQDKKGHFTLDVQRYKRTDYTYDLVSGNVKEVAYQEGEFDQFLHRYTYDADNRITNVTTSKDGLIWDTDASYNYYHHGPLARTELGEFKVQGMDFAYTLQGWLKGMNSSTLDVERDMHDDDNSPSYNVARDAYSYSLHYFNNASNYYNDYFPIGANGLGGASDAMASITGMNSVNLYNGNIGAIVNSLWDINENPMKTHGNRYRYDQLNRLVEMDVFHKYASGVDGVIEDNNFDQATLTQDYSVRLNYDANGNIKTLVRNGYQATGVNRAMDNLTYNYTSGTNRLSRVDDAVGSGNYATDIDDQNTNNYAYDNIGNLTKDESEGISSITWTVGGKIKHIIHNVGSKPDLEFEYDAMGNRITKIEKPRSDEDLSTQDNWIYTHYVRDASGNVMAIYKETFAPCNHGGCSGASHTSSLSVEDQPIYGSDRVGSISDDRVQLGKISFSGGDIIYHSVSSASYGSYRERELGHKNYELKNHLGNVQVTVADYKIWKPTTTTAMVFEHEFDDEGEVEEWEPLNDVDVQFNEGSLFVAMNGGESGIMKLVEGINTQCSYRFCITISELEPAPLSLVIRDQNENVIVNEEIHEAGTTICWDIEGLEEVESFTISLTSPEGEGYFILDHSSLSHTCPSAILIADVTSAQDYYPFGSTMPGRTFNGGSYRYGFNGKEMDNEVSGNGNQYDYGFRIYNPRLGRFLSVDPLFKSYPWLTPYQFAANIPIRFIDLDGLETYDIMLNEDKSVAYIKKVKDVGDNNSDQVYRGVKLQTIIFV